MPTVSHLVPGPNKKAVEAMAAFVGQKMAAAAVACSSEQQKPPSSLELMLGVLRCSPHAEQLKPSAETMSCLGFALNEYENEVLAARKTTPPNFANLALKEMIEAAASYDELFRSTPIRSITSKTPSGSNERAIDLTKRQCFAIQSAAFFCAFDRPSKMYSFTADSLPSINYDEMFLSHGPATNRSNVEVEKLKMFFDYFVEMAERVRNNHPSLDSQEDSIVFLRAQCSKEKVQTVIRAASDKPLIPAVVHPLRESIDHQKEMYRVDFANCVIGGASLSFGCVQEEIMFALCPEMQCARMMFSPMNDDEAIVMARCEQFSLLKPGTYAFTLKYGGKVVDTKARQSLVVAIDALDFRSLSRRVQYERDGIDRELVKATAGFCVQEQLAQHGFRAPQELATGNWGCGAFLGDVELKSILQWIAASACGYAMHYFPFDNRIVDSSFQRLVDGLVAKKVPANDVLRFLYEDKGASVQRGPGVYAAVAAKFGVALQ